MQPKCCRKCRLDGLLGGDAHFGSIMSSVETKKLWFKVNSMFAIKNHARLFPISNEGTLKKARLRDHCN